MIGAQLSRSARRSLALHFFDPVAFVQLEGEAALSRRVSLSQNVFL